MKKKAELPWTYKTILYKDRSSQFLKPLPLDVANVMVQGLVQLGGVVMEDDLHLKGAELYSRVRIFNRYNKSDTGIVFIPLIPYYIACVDLHMATGIKYDTKSNPWNFNKNTIRMLEPISKMLDKNK